MHAKDAMRVNPVVSVCPVSVFGDQQYGNWCRMYGLCYMAELLNCTTLVVLLLFTWIIFVFLTFDNHS